MTRAELIEALETAQGADSALNKKIAQLVGLCLHPAGRQRDDSAQSDTGYTCLDCGADSWGAKSKDGFNRRRSDPIPNFTGSIDAAMMLATGDNAKFIALSDAMVALEKAGWPNGTWHEHLPRFIAATCLRAGGE